MTAEEIRARLKVRLIEPADVPEVYRIWKLGFMELSNDLYDIAVLEQGYKLHLIMFGLMAAVGLVGFFLVGLPLYAAVVVWSTLFALDRLTPVKFYTAIGRFGMRIVLSRIAESEGQDSMSTFPAISKYWLQPDFSALWVADLDGQPVGCVACRLQHTIFETEAEDSNAANRTPEASIWRLSVNTQIRQCGIGRLLMDHAERWARDHGATHMSLMTANKASQAFYRRLQYTTETPDRLEAILQRYAPPAERKSLRDTYMSRLDPSSGTVFAKSLVTE
jgi:ribosomal protein S18 acetylase RimI-like enzyme